MSPAEQVRLLDAAVALAKDGTPIPEVVAPWVQDARDRAHLVLVRRSELVAQLLTTLEEGSRRRIAALVERMAAGMKRASEVRAATRGVIAGAERERYCRAVLAEPLLFAESELRSAIGLPADLSADRREAGLAVGELVQLANVCRDVEKDLARGVAYEPELAPWIGRPDGAPAEAVAAVRRRILERAASLAGAVVPFFGGLPFRPRVGRARRVPRPADHDGAVLPARQRGPRSAAAAPAARCRRDLARGRGLRGRRPLARERATLDAASARAAVRARRAYNPRAS